MSLLLEQLPPLHLRHLPLLHSLEILIIPIQRRIPLIMFLRQRQRLLIEPIRLEIFGVLWPFEGREHLDRHVFCGGAALELAELVLLGGWLRDGGADVDGAEGVGVEEVVPEIELVEGEGNLETRVVWGEVGF